MNFHIGDTVHTTSGKLYVIRSLYIGMRGERVAGLAPPRPRPGRRRTTATVSALTLVRTRELSLAFHYASMSEALGLDEELPARHRARAAHWLTKAEERNDDSRAALCLGTDRILELEAATP